MITNITNLLFVIIKSQIFLNFAWFYSPWIQKIKRKFYFSKNCFKKKYFIKQKSKCWRLFKFFLQNNISVMFLLQKNLKHSPSQKIFIVFFSLLFYTCKWIDQKCYHCCFETCFVFHLLNIIFKRAPFISLHSFVSFFAVFFTKSIQYCLSSISISTCGRGLFLKI